MTVSSHALVHVVYILLCALQRAADRGKKQFARSRQSRLRSGIGPDYPVCRPLAPMPMHANCALARCQRPSLHHPAERPCLFGRWLCHWFAGCLLPGKFDLLPVVCGADHQAPNSGISGRRLVICCWLLYCGAAEAPKRPVPERVRPRRRFEGVFRRWFGLAGGSHDPLWEYMVVSTHKAEPAVSRSLGSCILRAAFPAGLRYGAAPSSTL